MKILYIFLIVTISFASINSYSQDRRNRRQNENSDKKGKVSGKVIDETGNTPLESATVQLLRARDSSLVTGASTGKDGKFVLDAPFGRFKLRISFIGYNNAVINNISINPQSLEFDAGEIKLTAGSEMTTKEIVVEAEVPLMENQIDKKVYNVEKNIISESGSATDVLKNVPSVSVDEEGRVSLRGSGNVRILINGRPSTMLGTDPAAVLDQIPANTIQSIEIINNPSSKYDPEGTAGIINIILKKSLDDGYNANASISGGTKDKYNSSVGLSLRKNMFNIFGRYSFRLNNNGGTGATIRQNLFSDSAYYTNQYNITNRRMTGHMVNAGIDFEPDRKNLISFSGAYNYRDRTSNDNNLYQTISSSNILLQDYNRFNTEDETNNNVDLNLTYRLKFQKPKEELNAALLFSHAKEQEPETYRQIDNFTNALTLLQNDATDFNLDMYTAKADYYHPIDDKARWEMGYQSQFRKTTDNYSSQYYDFINSQWVYNTLLSNDFTYQDQIHALYGLYANYYKDFGYQFGLRVEQTYSKSIQYTQNETFENNYLSFFPSIYLSQTIDKSNELQISYTRRINRPRIDNLNPFIDYSDPQNLRQGNPYLKPEYVNAFELGYLRYFSSLVLTNSIFYKQTNDVINRIISVSDSGVSLMTFENLAKAESYGIEFILTGNILKWWNINGNFSYFKTIISGGANGELDNNSYNWSTKFMTSMSFPHIIDVQISYNYSGKILTAQGSLEPFQSMDIAMKKDFMQKKVSLSLRVSDIFNTMKFAYNSSGTGFVTNFVRKRDSRNAFLTLSIRLGTDQNQQKSRRKREQQDDNNNENPSNDY